MQLAQLARPGFICAGPGSYGFLVVGAAWIYKLAMLVFKSEHGIWLLRGCAASWSGFAVSHEFVNHICVSWNWITGFRHGLRIVLLVFEMRFRIWKSILWVSHRFAKRSVIFRKTKIQFANRKIEFANPNLGFPNPPESNFPRSRFRNPDERPAVVVVKWTGFWVHML